MIFPFSFTRVISIIGQNTGVGHDRCSLLGGSPYMRIPYCINHELRRGGVKCNLFLSLCTQRVFIIYIETKVMPARLCVKFETSQPIFNF